MLSQETLTAAQNFRHEREWQRYHTPLNLAVAIAVEAGELLEQFQWSVPEEPKPTSEQHKAVAHEIADLIILLSYLTHDLGLDADTIVSEKLALNGMRYPVAKAKGNAKKYDQL